MARQGRHRQLHSVVLQRFDKHAEGAIGSYTFHATSVLLSLYSLGKQRHLIARKQKSA